MQNNNKQFEILDILTLLSFYLQVINLEELKRQATNDDIIEEIKNDMSRINEKLDYIITCTALLERGE